MTTNYGDEGRPIYPFTAIVAQNELKSALILNAIDPSIGGVLLTGPKGTGKSSIVRAATEVFPEIDAVVDCVFGCNPFDPTRMCEECRSRFAKDNMLPKRKKRMRVVTLPLSATEDRVIGSLDVEAALRKGTKALQPGILAEANQSILYIDEVNLLPDHLVDMILDVSASGWNEVEREGISINHPSNFILAGSMNPEEGELRPQILDRFGLHAEAQRLLNPKERIEVIQRGEEFLKDPLAFRKEYEPQQEELRRKIRVARDILPKVQVPQSVMESIARICTRLQVDGYRPDIVIMRAARALAAFNNRETVLPDDVVAASNLALSHRTRKSGQRDPPTSKEIHKALEITPVGKEILFSKMGRLGKFGRLMSLDRVMRIPLLPLLGLALLITLLTLFSTSSLFPELLLQFFAEVFSSLDQAFKFFLVATLAFVIITLLVKRPEKRVPARIIDLARITSEQMSDRRVVRVEKQSSKDSIRTPAVVDTTVKQKVDVEKGAKVFEGIVQSKTTEHLKRTTQSRGGRVLRGRSYLVGKRAPVVTSLSRGRYVWHELPKEKPWNIALGPTIRAAAPYQQARKTPDLSVVIKPQDIRVKMREYRAPFSIVILVDLSLSMVSSIVNLGRAISTLHRSVYRRRDRVGLVVFKGDDSLVLQEPTTNVDSVVRKLWKTGASDLTPMAAGMLKAWRVLRLEKQRNKDSILMLIIVSDGIANIPLKHPLSRLSRKILRSEAQVDCMDVARLLARDEVRTVVINTAHSPLEARIREEPSIYIAKGLLTPTEFLMEVSKVTKGSYYGLVLEKEDTIPLTSKKRKLDDWLYFEEETKQ